MIITTTSSSSSVKPLVARPLTDISLCSLRRLSYYRTSPREISSRPTFFRKCTKRRNIACARAHRPSRCLFFFSGLSYSGRNIVGTSKGESENEESCRSAARARRLSGDAAAPPGIAGGSAADTALCRVQRRSLLRNPAATAEISRCERGLRDGSPGPGPHQPVRLQPSGLDDQLAWRSAQPGQRLHVHHHLSLRQLPHRAAGRSAQHRVHRHR